MTTKNPKKKINSKKVGGIGIEHTVKKYYPDILNTSLTNISELIISNNQNSYKISNNQDFKKAIKELSELQLQRQLFNKDQKYYFYKCMVYGEIYYILSIYINLTNTTNTNIIIKKKDKFKNNFEEFFKSVEDKNYKDTIINEFILVNKNKLMEINQPTDLKLLKKLLEYFIYFNSKYEKIIKNK
jgi:hypothetical protein